MQIPKNTLKKWETLKSNEDTPKLAEKAGVSDQAIRNAFKYGKCSEETFIAIGQFYEERLKKIAPFITKTLA